jgi:hypothetical protein
VHRRQRLIPLPSARATLTVAEVLDRLAMIDARIAFSGGTQEEGELQRLAYLDMCSLQGWDDEAVAQEVRPPTAELIIIERVRIDADGRRVVSRYEGPGAGAPGIGADGSFCGYPGGAPLRRRPGGRRLETVLA